jgi:membrane protein required for colicin V production
MTFVPVDYFFCFLILIFGITAFARGFVSSVFGKAAWIAGVLGGIFFHKQVAVQLKPKISNELLCIVLAFLILFVVVFLLVKICETILQKIFQNKILGSLDRGLGLLFGLIEGFAIVCLIIFILGIQPFVDTGNLFHDSFFVKLMGIVLNSELFQKAGGKK